MGYFLAGGHKSRNQAAKEEMIFKHLSDSSAITYVLCVSARTWSHFATWCLAGLTGAPLCPSSAADRRFPAGSWADRPYLECNPRAFTRVQASYTGRGECNECLWISSAFYSF